MYEKKPDEIAEALKAKLTKREFQVDDWIIRSEDAREYFKTINQGKLKLSTPNPMKVVGMAAHSGKRFDVAVLVNGEVKHTSSKFYRLATEEEIIAKQLKDVFKGERKKRDK